MQKEENWGRQWFKKKILLVEKVSKSWTCSYCFSFSFNSSFFHLLFLDANGPESISICLSGFWPCTLAWHGQNILDRRPTNTDLYYISFLHFQPPVSLPGLFHPQNHIILTRLLLHASILFCNKWRIFKSSPHKSGRINQSLQSYLHGVTNGKESFLISQFSLSSPV